MTMAEENMLDLKDPQTSQSIAVPVAQDLNGVLNRWLIVGPFAAESDAEKQAQLVPPVTREHTDPLFKTFASIRRQGEADWQFHQESGRINLYPGVGMLEHSKAYLFTVVEREKAELVLGTLEPDDVATVWLNGERLGRWGIGRHVLPMQMQEGRNFIFIESVNHGGAWSLSLALHPPLQIPVSIISPNADAVNDELQALLYRDGAQPQIEIRQQGRPLPVDLTVERHSAGGTPLWEIGWDGKLDNGDRVSAGDYELAVRQESGQTMTQPFTVTYARDWSRVLEWREAFFPLAVFVDGNHVVHQAAMREMCEDLLAREMNTVFFVNQNVERNAPLLEVSDELGINVIYAFTELHRLWFDSSVSGDEFTAESVIKPLVERVREHPSLKGYYIYDEPGLHLKDKLTTASRIIESLDPDRPTTICYIGLDRVDPLYSQVQNRVKVIDIYPAGYNNQPGDFRLTGFGYRDWNFVSYLREVTKNKPETVPLWIILQTHNFQRSLREPTVEEVRLQTWLSLAEGAKGLIYFTYHTQQGWTGLEEGGPLMEEATRLTRLIKPQTELLLRLDPLTPDLIGGSPYVDTQGTPSFSFDGFHARLHADRESGQRYLIAANPDVENARALRLPEGRVFFDLMRDKPVRDRVMIQPGGGVFLREL